jgi:hypothetical protein
MATQKVLVVDPTTSFDKELTPNTTSAGATDAGKLIALNGSGVLDSTLFPPGLGITAKTFPASEALAAGALVNIWSNAGVPSVRNANATDATKPAVGVVLAAYASGATATIYYGPVLVAGLSGLTVGAVHFLGITAGTVTATAPSATGNYMQAVGVADSATELAFETSPGGGVIRG